VFAYEPEALFMQVTNGIATATTILAFGIIGAAIVGLI